MLAGIIRGRGREGVGRYTRKGALSVWLQANRVGFHALPFWILECIIALRSTGYNWAALDRCVQILYQARDGRFDSKVGQMAPKWDKSMTFSDQISVLKTDLKKSRICPILEPIWPTLEPNLPSLYQTIPRYVKLGQNWARLARNGTNLGLFKINIQYIWLTLPNVQKTDL